MRNSVCPMKIISGKFSCFFENYRGGSTDAMKAQSVSSDSMNKIIGMCENLGLTGRITEMVSVVALPLKTQLVKLSRSLLSLLLIWIEDNNFKCRLLEKLHHFLRLTQISLAFQKNLFSFYSRIFQVSLVFFTVCHPMATTWCDNVNGVSDDLSLSTLLPIVLVELCLWILWAMFKTRESIRWHIPYIIWSYVIGDIFISHQEVSWNCKLCPTNFE